MPELPINVLGWSAMDKPPAGFMGRWSRGFDTSRGELWDAKGFIKKRQVADKTNKAAAARIHVGPTGKRWGWFYLDANLYKNDGATPTSMVASLTEKFNPAIAMQAAPANMSVFLNGTNADAQMVSENAASTDIEAADFDFAQATVATITTSPAGGSIADGTYQIRVCGIDDDGGYVSVFTEPSAVQEITTAGGGTSTITVPEPTLDARANKYRIAITQDGATDSPANYILYDDFTTGSGQTLTALPTNNSPNTAFGFIQSTYNQATMPITDADLCIMHEGRLFIASTKSNNIAFSLRDNPNHWNTLNTLTNGFDKGWNAMMRGFASMGGTLYTFTDESVHVVAGDFTRADDGANPSYALRVGTDVIDRNIGLVSHASVVTVGQRTYFMSTQGPALLAGRSVALVANEHIRPEFDCWDWPNIARCHGAEDAQNHYVCWAVPRGTNASREMDGASTAGICDTIYRFDWVRGVWAAPLAMETVDLAALPDGAQGTESDAEKTVLNAMGPHGSFLQLGFGRAGGTADGVVTAATYDGLLATTEATTSAIVTLSGISADDFKGFLALLKYHTDDTNFPDVTVVKTISSNTASSGGSVTINWQGAITVSTGTKWTVRIAGFYRALDWRGDLREIAGLPANARVQLQDVELQFADVIGAEAIA